jgi:multiple sugar transport system substrate-binding protein
MSDTPSAEGMSRRKLLEVAGLSAIAAAAGTLGLPQDAAAETGSASVEISKWSPEYVRSIAGTAEYDTAADCAKVVPLDYSGRLTYWYVGPNQAAPEIEAKIDAEFWEAFARTYPNIKVTKQSLDYNDIVNKLRTAAIGRAAPMVTKIVLSAGCEFASKGQLMPLAPEDVGYPRTDFWPGAMKSVMWKGKAYGVPTRNETMGLVWNAGIFKAAGLEPESPPATWDDLVSYSKQIKDRTGKNGYGLIARVNAGNTAYRLMPQLWAYGGGALDETEPNPTYTTIMANNAGSKAALQAAVDMYVRDRSVPVSALTNTQIENQDPFIAGQLGIMIAHPAEYAVMLDKARKATGSDKAVAEEVIANMRYGLLPKGPARRAVAFGGWNAHIFDHDIVDGGLDVKAAKAFVCFLASPEWTTKDSWVSSNPGNIRGFRTKWMKQRLEQIKFLDVTTSMLPSGIPFPILPQSTEIVNIIMPEMLQNALTQKMTVAAAADDAARKLKDLLKDF